MYFEGDLGCGLGTLFYAEMHCSTHFMFHPYAVVKIYCT